MKDKPFISVIVPVHNGAKYLDVCLEALAASTYPGFEVIVVDDASTDAWLANSNQARIIHLSERSGPAAARNRGAREAAGDLLFFVDVDVLVRPDTLGHAAELFIGHPEVAAIFGSYDDAPAEPDFVSQYKNLYHHFVHQRSRPEALTFWSGCGAITREAFENVGGFDAHRFSEPSIEDIEMGQRLIAMGLRIRLEKSLQVKHLKRWTLSSLLYADIFRRALPWSKLVLESGRLANDLNLSWPDRASAAIAGLLLLIPLALWFPYVAYVGAGLAASILLLNRELYVFFIRRRGLVFAATAFPMQVLYYLYSGITFAFCCAVHLARGESEAGETRAP
jgi:glycosyltransferase involved in cell wall biosynthesis